MVHERNFNIRSVRNEKHKYVKEREREKNSWSSDFLMKFNLFCNKKNVKVFDWCLQSICSSIAINFLGINTFNESVELFFYFFIKIFRLSNNSLDFFFYDSLSGFSNSMVKYRTKMTKNNAHSFEKLVQNQLSECITFFAWFSLLLFSFFFFILF